mgnify:FL=1
MLHQGAQRNFIETRVNLPTAKSSREIARDVPPGIRARSFFSSRISQAHVADYYRSTLDDYLKGGISRDECRNRMRRFARQHGLDDGSNALTNIGSTSRLNLIIDQNAKMAKAVGTYERMYSPGHLEAFPYVIYRASVRSKKPRASHQKYDGMIIRKDDPWLRTHTPPWEFNCTCELEECSEKRAGKGKVKKPTPPDQVRVESRSGFSFDPAHAFETHDLSTLRPMSRSAILRQAEEAVRNQELGSVGLIAAPPLPGAAPSPLPELGTVKDGFDAMRDQARKELRAVGLDPDRLPDYKEVNRAFEQAGRQGKNVPGSVIDKFPKEPFEVAKLNPRAAEAAGLPELPVKLGRGNAHYGIEHLWRNHKELFTDPNAAIRLLKETLGNQNCRVVVSLKRAVDKSYGQRKVICLKRIVLHNPQTQAYCVLVWDGKELKLVSWNNAGDDYGDSEWTLK